MARATELLTGLRYRRLPACLSELATAESLDDDEGDEAWHLPILPGENARNLLFIAEHYASASPLPLSPPSGEIFLPPPGARRLQRPQWRRADAERDEVPAVVGAAMSLGQGGHTLLLTACGQVRKDTHIHTSHRRRAHVTRRAHENGHRRA
jgi:hypothetical protein